ncbi:hypothetical protein [Flavobacterium sp.]|uniref:hypothetical protein n=1 Tax=Flavobacterium sp. TaxID=239 RepID=UPI004047FBFE
MKKLINYSNNEIFSRLINNKSKENYWNYISELRKRKTEDIFEKSISLTNTENQKEKIIGINILAQFGFPRKHKNQILKTFFDLLKTEKDKNVISSIFYGIGHNNEKLTEKQIEQICAFKNHKSINVKFSLVSALLSIEQTKAIETLIELSNDKNSDVRDWATFGIGTQIEENNENIQNALWKRINDKDIDTKNEAIVGLAKRNVIGINEIIKTEIIGNEFNTLIFEAIEYTKDKELLNLLKENFELNKNNIEINPDWISEMKNFIESQNENNYK